MNMRIITICAACLMAIAMAGCAQKAGMVFKADTPMATQEADALACGATGYAPELGVSIEPNQAASFRDCMRAKGYTVTAG